MEAAIMDEALQSRVINLLADAPRGDPRRASYLLAALAHDLPPGCVVVAVVDPGVGTARDGLIVEAGGRLYVGPDNGLLSRVVDQAPDSEVWRIDWQPPRLSNTFHGRDLFAPVAGMLSTGQAVPRSELRRTDMVGVDWPGQLPEVLYIDRFGNAMTGLRADTVEAGAQLQVAGNLVSGAATYGDVRPGAALWYANSCGLIEIAVNQGTAAEQFGLTVGVEVQVLAGNPG
jgi:S-adenosylmethionine hydrolase